MKTKLKKQELKVACWNVRTMPEKANRSGHKCRSVLIAHKLSRLDIDTAAFSDACPADEGSLQEFGACLIHFWSGRPSADRRISDVEFVARKIFAYKQEISSTCHSDSIISMRLP